MIKELSKNANRNRGGRKVGSTLAAELSREDHDIVMIDRDPDVLKELVDRTDVSAVVGNGATLQAQRDAGVGESELLIAATSSDEVNVLCCMLGRKLGVKHTIARVRSPEYPICSYFSRRSCG